MSRTLRTAVIAAVAVAALLSTVTAGAAPAVKRVDGTVGPGFTISMTLAGKKVSKLKAGVPYRFVINDRSSSHDFHLHGPGIDRVITGVGFTGTKSVTLKLKKGSYSYVCDPHSGSMKGSFQVT